MDETRSHRFAPGPRPVDGKTVKPDSLSGSLEPKAARPALDVEVILTPSCILSSLVILYTKYRGWRQNDFNVYA
jgi:hypothetical protein